MLRNQRVSFRQAGAFLNKNWVLAGLSGLLLAFCQPGYSLGYLVWISIFLLIIAANRAHNLFHAFRLGFVCGLFFFAPGLHWLQNVAFPAWLFAVLIEAFFIGIFSGIVFLGRVLGNSVHRLIWISSGWLLCEWIRAEIPVLGFGWHLLAYSQSQYPAFLQVASLFGAYGLSFLIALTNTSLYLGFQAWQTGGKFKQVFLWISLAVAIPLCLFVYGRVNLAASLGPGEQLRIGLVQSNIPETIKWRPEAKDKILEIHQKLTQLVSFEGADLIVWPEASFPGYFNRDQEAEQVRELAFKTKTPILVGSPHFERAGIYYNSAYLVRGGDTDEDRYDKVRLVPFGEYVPFKWLFGWLMPLADAFGVGDFSPGLFFKKFQLYDDVAFGTLICFEDIFPSISREYVRRGARFLVVMTNDSWFGRTHAPYQHLAASIFRAVENGVPVVRAANTGVSALISSKGQVTNRVVSGDGKDLFVTGHGTGTIRLDFHKTYYQKSGYLLPLVLFVVMCNLGGLLWLRQGLEKLRRQKESK